MISGGVFAGATSVSDSPDMMSTPSSRKVGTSGSTLSRSVQVTPNTFMVREARREAGQRRLDLPAGDVGDRAGGAAVVHVLDLDPGQHRHLRRQDVQRRADAAVADIDLAGVRLGVGDEFPQRLHGQLGRYDDHLRNGADQRGRCEILHRVVVQRLVEHAVVAEWSGRGEQQRVAVGLRLRDGGGADGAAGAAAVLDHDPLLEPLAELVRQHAGDAVGRAAGRERRDHGDGAVWPALRRGRSGNGEYQCGGEEKGRRRHRGCFR